MDCSTPGFPVLHYFPELLNYQGYVLVPMAGKEGKEVKSLCMGLTTTIDHGIKDGLRDKKDFKRLRDNKGWQVSLSLK